MCRCVCVCVGVCVVGGGASQHFRTQPPCTRCRFVNEEKILEIEIEPGMRDGYQYPFVSEGQL